MSTTPVTPPLRCALILAGGRSRRMGMDKYALTVQGQTLLERAVAFWTACGMDRIYVSLHPGLSVSLPESVTPIFDVVSDCGPLGGLISAFRTTDAPLLWVSAVDMPVLLPDAVLDAPAGDAAVYRTGTSPQPLFGVYRRSILPTLETMHLQGDFRMMELLRRVDTRWVDAPKRLEPMFQNWNTPEDLLRGLAGTPPMLSVSAWSGTGKTTFLESLIPALKRRGRTVAAIKHSHHPAQPESPNKDTARLQAAGADQVRLWTEDLTPEHLRETLTPTDLILVEGCKFGPLPKLALHRCSCPDYFPEEPTVLAHITDHPLPVSRPQFSWTDADRCADLICTLFPNAKPCER